MKKWVKKKIKILKNRKPEKNILKSSVKNYKKSKKIIMTENGEIYIRKGEYNYLNFIK